MRAQTAEKRKAMLDEMAIQLNQEKSDHKEALSDLKLQHEKEARLTRPFCNETRCLTGGHVMTVSVPPGSPRSSV